GTSPAGDGPEDDGDSAAAPPAKKQRKGRRGSTAQSPGDGSGPRREKYLEKNRVAASKCRQKKKQWEMALDARVRELEAARACLRPYVTALREEVIALKSELLKHVDCGCTAIQEYLAESASHILPVLAVAAAGGDGVGGVGGLGAPGLDRRLSLSMPATTPTGAFRGGFMAAADTLDIGPSEAQRSEISIPKMGISISEIAIFDNGESGPALRGGGPDHRPVRPPF
ncbi:hypothetical protein AOQ84DRAFT_368304, partial [Glonium stellatum]